MRPSALLLKLVSFLLLVTTSVWALRLYPDVGPAWLTPENLQVFLALMALCLALAALTDYVVARRYLDVSVSRELVGALSQGSRNTYALITANRAPWKLRLSVVDGLPASFDSTQVETFVDVHPEELFSQQVTVTPIRRGDYRLEPAWVHAVSRWGLWVRRLRRGEPQSIQVYPNFSMLRAGPEFGLEEQIQRMGVHRVQRRGRGMDFHQLREFVVGDSPNQVDWKATSRLNKLIAREYQDDRDQRLFFLLDGGHRMRAMDQGLSLFDHAINALLVTSHVALKQPRVSAE